jgi:hypothetical protein
MHVGVGIDAFKRWLSGFQAARRERNRERCEEVSSRHGLMPVGTLYPTRGACEVAARAAGVTGSAPAWLEVDDSGSDDTGLRRQCGNQGDGHRV